MLFKMSFQWIDLGFKEIVKGLQTLKTSSLEIGVLKNTNKRAQYAFFNEFGTHKIPETPFLRSSLTNDNLKNVEKKIEQALTNFYSQKKPMEFLRTIGEWQKKVIKNQIDQKIFLPNHPRTIAQKGFDHRLIEKGLLYKMIDYEIK